MNSLEEFKEVVEGNYGITNLQQYETYKKVRGEQGVPTEEIDLMSPDNPTFNSSSFWEYIEKHPELARDAIAFGLPGTATHEEVNHNNFGLACIVGVFNYILILKDFENLPVLDIGAGYGMMRDFVKQHTKLKYYGVDVYPKFEGCRQVASDGYTLPDEILNTKFGMVISTNVFQHLSINQRRKYYEQISKILLPQFGFFTLMMPCVIPGAPNCTFKGKDNKKEYMCHYGQYTEMQSINEVQEDLRQYFNLNSISQRLDSNPSTFTLNCRLK